MSKITFQIYLRKKTKTGAQSLFEPLKCQTKIAADDILIFTFIFEENKAWFFHVNPLLAEDSLGTLSLIFSEKQWRNIYECRLLQSWLAL